MFAAADLDTPALDARIIVGHALALDYAALAGAAERTLDIEERERIAAMAARRLAGEPVARIVGMKEFWGLPLRVTPAVLVPRPETETVVEIALAANRGGKVDENSEREHEHEQCNSIIQTMVTPLITAGQEATALEKLRSLGCLK